MRAAAEAALMTNGVRAADDIAGETLAVGSSDGKVSIGSTVVAKLGSGASGNDGDDGGW